MSKLEALLRDGGLMDYLKQNGHHDWGCNSWSEGQNCCLQEEAILAILLRLLEESDG